MPGTTAPRRRLPAVLAAAIAAVVTALSAAPSHAADPYVPITGSGSTWSFNALDQWRKNVKANYGMTVNYEDVGSTVGRTQFINNQVDFAVSEIPFQTTMVNGATSVENPPAGAYAYMPIVAGGTAFMYNLKINGRQVTNLRLSGQTITKIFTGVITKWNDPQIQADNPGLAMPDRGITPVVRSDGSGTSAQFSMWMSKRHGDLWNAFCARVGWGAPCGLTSNYPVIDGFKAQYGSLGVAGYVSQGYGEGAITYVEYSYALKANFPVVKVLNEAGYYVEPTASSVAVALLQARINNDPNSADYLTQILDDVYANADPRAYPLSSYSYMILPTQVRPGGTFSVDKGRTLSTFGNYFLCEGQQQAESLGYSPLPMNLVLAGAEQIKRIPGANTGGFDINRCNNPTFKPGESVSDNQLAKTAPRPPDCDKVGPVQCTTGTAGAKTDTPTTGGQNAGQGGVDTGTSDAGAGEANGNAGGDTNLPTDGDLQYDADGVPVGNRSSSSTVVAAASPVDLEAATGWGAGQTLMVIAGVLLLGLVAGPPLFARRLSGGQGIER